MLDPKVVDAVLIATPVHWHALICIDSLKARKHSYIEKPLSLTIEEARQIVTAKRGNDRVCQVGMQQRSGKHYLEHAEVAKGAALGAPPRVIVRRGVWSRLRRSGCT